MIKFYKYEIDISSLVVHDGEDVIDKKISSVFHNQEYPGREGSSINRGIAAVYFSKETIDFFHKNQDKIQLFLFCGYDYIYEVTPIDIKASPDNYKETNPQYKYLLRTDDKSFAMKLKLNI